MFFYWQAAVIWPAVSDGGENQVGFLSPGGGLGGKRPEFSAEGGTGFFAGKAGDGFGESHSAALSNLPVRGQNNGGPPCCRVGE